MKINWSKLIELGLAGLLIGLILTLGYGPLPDRQNDSQLRLAMLDVGQGDAIYIRLPGGFDVVIDSGPNGRAAEQLARALPFGEREIELLILTHNHADHIGGADQLFSHYRIGQVITNGARHDSLTYQRLEAALERRDEKITTVKAGDRINLGESTLTFLYPIGDFSGQTPKDQHEANLVFILRYRQFCALMTGDINTDSRDDEAAIIEYASAQSISLECEVLKVAHHGSASATTNAFLIAVKPKIGLISAGIDNRYGHPTASTLSRLREAGVTIWRTDLNGTISVTSDGRRTWTIGEK